VALVPARQRLHGSIERRDSVRHAHDPVNASGNPAQVIRDFYDYNTYNQSTFGHLNADGLSFVDRYAQSGPESATGARWRRSSPDPAL